jgi:hypothetical protein
MWSVTRTALQDSHIFSLNARLIIAEKLRCFHMYFLVRPRVTKPNRFIGTLFFPSLIASEKGTTMDAFSDIRPIPLDVILSWPKPNYVDPIRRGPALVIVNSLLLPVALVVVGLRLYTRLKICRSAGLDDLFIALAVVWILFSRPLECLLTSTTGPSHWFDYRGVPRY